MNTYDKTISIISTIIKTLISFVLCFIGWAICLFNITRDNVVLGIIFSGIFLYIFWKICPSDTKNWIKNWTKPQLTKEK